MAAPAEQVCTFARDKKCCRYGDKCNFASTHQAACKFGDKCEKMECLFLHPNELCRDGAACASARCHRRHPRDRIAPVVVTVKAAAVPVPVSVSSAIAVEGEARRGGRGKGSRKAGELEAALQYLSDNASEVTVLSAVVGGKVISFYSDAISRVDLRK